MCKYKSWFCATLLIILACFYQQVSAQISVSIQIDQPVSCHGAQDAQLTATVPPGAGFQFHWSNGANTSTVQGVGAGTYVVTVTGAAGGTSVATAVVPEPDALIASVSFNGILNCLNTSVTAVAHGAGGVSPYNFQWLNGALDSVVQIQQGGAHTVVLTDANGCQAFATINIAQNTTVPVMQGPDTAYLKCLNGGVNIQKLCINSSTVIYQWIDPSGDLLPGASIVTASEGGWHQVRVTDLVNGCIGVDSVMVIDAALRAGAVGPGPVYLDSIAAWVSGGTAPYQFEWLVAGGPAVDSSQTLSGVPAGFYLLKITDAAGCFVTDGPFELQTTTATSDPDLVHVQIYPNPATDRITVQLPESGLYNMNIMNQQGISVWSQINRSGKVEVDTDTWMPGIYLINIATKTFKLVVLH